MQNVKYALLKAIGVTLWISNNAPLKSHAPLFCAPCLVILKEPPTLEEKTLLDKMLDVLKTPLCVAWINSTHPNEVLEAIQQWAPKTLLILGEGLEYLYDLPNTYHTYDPKTLTEFPDLKRETYHTLLELKAAL